MSAKKTDELVKEELTLKQDVGNAELFLAPKVSFNTTDPNSEFVTFVLKNYNSKGKYNLNGQSSAINPKTKRKEAIWYIPGEDSIWQSELVERLKDKAVVSKRGIIKFDKKRTRIRRTDTLAMEFLTNHPSNLDNPTRLIGEARIEFEEYNPAKIQAAKFAQELFEIKMTNKAINAPVEQMRKHAFYLNIKPNDDLGFPKSDDGIRSEYMVAAKRNPKLFDESFGSPVVEISYLIKKAIRDAKIDIGGSNGNVTWAGTSAFICRKPATKNPHDVLLELAMSTTAEGLAFKSQLSSLTS